MALKRLISNTSLAVDQFDEFAWVMLYGHDAQVDNAELLKAGVKYAVAIKKPKGVLPTEPELVLGDVPESLIITEHGAKYELRCLKTFHPGLFLDHQLTRKWLKDNSANKTVLNLFSYTGSLAIASALGGAKETLSLDLSNQTTLWAKQNALLNKLHDNHKFIKGDVFDWLKRLEKKQRRFDIVISDPPSQSRSDVLHFSTQQHLDFLHDLCLTCLAPSGTLITSVNTEMITPSVLIASVNHMAERQNRTIRRIETLPLPKGFDEDFRAMKGIRVFFSD